MSQDGVTCLNQCACDSYLQGYLVRVLNSKAFSDVFCHTEVGLALARCSAFLGKYSQNVYFKIKPQCQVFFNRPCILISMFKYCRKLKQTDLLRPFHV